MKNFKGPIFFLVAAIVIFIVNLLWGHVDLLRVKNVWLVLQGPYFISLVFAIIGICWALQRNKAGELGDAAAGNSQWADAWRRLKKNKMAVGCGIVFLVIFFSCFLGPTIHHWLTGMLPNAQDLTATRLAPNGTHFFGTDTLGRDVFIRTLVGGQISIIVGISATFVALVLGVLYGATSAFVGGKVDEVMMRIVDVMYAFPRVIFIIVVMAVLDTKNIVVLFALIGGISWLTMARIVRGQVLSLRQQEYVEAARSLGASNLRILIKHIIPNTMSVVIVYSTLSLPSVMLTEAFLSYLGLGVQAPDASWGTLVDKAQALVQLRPWLLLCPGIVMAVTIFALNFLGDGLRDALDPKMRKD